MSRQLDHYLTNVTENHTPRVERLNVSGAAPPLYRVAQGSYVPAGERGFPRFDEWAVPAHELKTLPRYFDQVWAGLKRAELRAAHGRAINVGDVLWMREHDSERHAGTAAYTGRIAVGRVTDVLQPADVSSIAEHARREEEIAASWHPRFEQLDGMPRLAMISFELEARLQVNPG